MINVLHSLTYVLLINNSRLARRGGVKRISGAIYEDVRAVLKKRLTDVSTASLPLTFIADATQVLRQICIVVGM